MITMLERFMESTDPERCRVWGWTLIIAGCSVAVATLVLIVEQLGVGL